MAEQGERDLYGLLPPLKANLNIGRIKATAYLLAVCCGARVLAPGVVAVSVNYAFVTDSMNCSRGSTLHVFGIGDVRDC